MRLVKNHEKGNGSTDYYADRPFTIAPIIAKTFFSGKGKSRVRMYRTECNRKFIADVFDKMFLPAIVLVVKHKHYKSKSLDARVIE
jgi:hypothetical protein